MTKAELIDAVSGKTGETKKAVGTVVDAAMAEIKANNKTTLIGFGIFQKKTRAARTGRNPATGASVQIPAKTSLTFKASKG